MSNETNKNIISVVNDHFVGKVYNIDKISELSTADIKVEEFLTELKPKEIEKTKSKKKVTFYPYITVKDVESYKEYNKEVYKKNINRSHRSNYTCACLIM